MSQDDAQERTEEPTPKRQKDAKKKGQVVRSKELNTSLVLIGSALGFIMFGPNLTKQIFSVVTHILAPSGEVVITNDLMLANLSIAATTALTALLPIFFMVVLFSIVGPILLGGWSFSIESLQPKLERIDPIKGIKKILSIKGLVELVKAILKFVIICGVAGLLMNTYFSTFMSFAYQDVFVSTVRSLELVGVVFLMISGSLILVSTIDIPFQIWQHHKSIKMTMQEVKDEFKETEGKPEVKGQIRKMQREISKRRMMAEVPTADVVITNPTHFAIALRYDGATMVAPKVVAKGADLIAQTIIQVAETNEVPVVQMPPLARAIFYSAELDDEVPAALYVAVAQVLAYVYQLSLFERGNGKKPTVPGEVEIPDEYKR